MSLGRRKASFRSKERINELNFRGNRFHTVGDCHSKNSGLSLIADASRKMLTMKSNINAINIRESCKKKLTLISNPH